MKLATKLTVAFLLLSIIPLGGVGYRAFKGGRETIERKTLDHLISVTILKEGEFKRWVKDSERSLRALAMRPLIKKYAAVVHGIEIGDYCLIGMGSIILGGAVVGPYSIIAAGALVREGAEIPEGSVVTGVPGRVVRQVTDKERAAMGWRASHYVQRAKSDLAR